MSTTVIVVQHGEKEPGTVDPGLTDRGRRQAAACASLLASRRASAVYASPLRRAYETASLVAAAIGVPVLVDSDIRERMDWSPTSGLRLDAFLGEWQRATFDRAYKPADSGGRCNEELVERLARAAPA
jgi:broad specificity phosphatase PhoE